jgi:hypothetical protein
MKSKGLTKNRPEDTYTNAYSVCYAPLPKKVYDPGIMEYFRWWGIREEYFADQKEYLNEVYDDALGTDKCILQFPR